ncbi:MAG: hypothetical protein IKI61_07520 [Erysipelotrichaceae bacterium]|nr:hypothetical protein [Erysipelotrichaceae bacterium]
MSTIKIKGYASRKVNADIIRYRITFIAKDMKVSKASEMDEYAYLYVTWVIE